MTITRKTNLTSRTWQRPVTQVWGLEGGEVIEDKFRGWPCGTGNIIQIPEAKLESNAHDGHANYVDSCNRKCVDRQPLPVLKSRLVAFGVSK